MIRRRTLHDAMKLMYYLEKKKRNKIKQLAQLEKWQIYLGFFFCRLMVNQIQSLVLSSGVPILY
jgi:hypothetical protein